jgi:hypothetical protein
MISNFTPFKIQILVVLLTFGICSLYGQTDSLVMKNGQYVIGEVKSMSRSVVVVETDYSDSDFKIEWDQVSQFYSKQFYLITLSNGDRITGTIQTDSANLNNLTIETVSETISTTVNDVVHVKPLEGSFLSRMSAAVSVGYNITKNNNLQQFSSRINLGYTADRWTLQGTYDAVRGSQDDVPDIKRTNGIAALSIFLERDYFVLISQEFLQNDEQLLALRSTSKAGFGKYLVHTNSATFGVSAGMVWNNERFTDDTPNRNSAEAAIGTQLDLFDIGDLNLLSNLNVYPSITESGRIRADFKLDLKYDLPRDFFISLGYTHNFDNQPIAGAAENDYIFQTSFGWEL